MRFRNGPFNELNLQLLASTSFYSLLDCRKKLTYVVTRYAGSSLNLYLIGNLIRNIAILLQSRYGIRTCRSLQPYNQGRC